MGISGLSQAWSRSYRWRLHGDSGDGVSQRRRVTINAVSAMASAAMLTAPHAPALPILVVICSSARKSRRRRRRVRIEQRLLHDSCSGDHIANPAFQVPLMDGLGRVIARLGRRGHGGVEDRVPDVTAGGHIRVRQRAEVHVICQRRARGMHLHAPNLLTLLNAGNIKQRMRPNAPLKCGVEVRGEVGQRKMTIPRNDSSSVSSTLTTVFDSRRDPVAPST